MSKPYVVDANYRFIAAYQEVNARIAQRQQALALYVTLVVSLLAALVALRPAPGAPEPPVEWLVLGFPVASVCLALLNHKSERAITNLRTFLSRLERLDSAHLHLPSYNTEPQWASSANKARRFHDWATAVLALGGNALGLGAAWQIYPHRLGQSGGVLLAAAGVTALAVGTLVRTSRRHYSPDTPDDFSA